MSNERSEKDYIVLGKIIERIQRVMAYCDGQTYEGFEANTMLQEACVFNILQVGELSKHSLSDEMMQMYPSLPWRQMNGLRNHIVHGYEGVRLNIVWDTIVNDFPSLLVQLQTIAKEKN
jgi:uncharacterized protein with HEPN domain